MEPCPPPPTHIPPQSFSFLLFFPLSFSFFLCLVAVCQSFCLFFIFYNIHTIIQSHSYNTFAEASLHLLIASKLSGTDLPVVPSRESNSRLPSSKARVRFFFSSSSSSSFPRLLTIIVFFSFLSSTSSSLLSFPFHFLLFLFS